MHPRASPSTGPALIPLWNRPHAPLWHTCHDKRRPSGAPPCPLAVAFSWSPLSLSVPETQLAYSSPSVTPNLPACRPLYWPCSYASMESTSRSSSVSAFGLGGGPCNGLIAHINSARQPQAAGVGLAHACTPAAVRALTFGRAHITPQLKVTQPS